MPETVLIIGANRGLGLEFAKQYQQLGYKVIGTARRPKELAALPIQREELDVTDPKSIRALAEKLKGTPIDLLLNNAGVFLKPDDPLESLRMEDVNLTFAVNCTGPLFVTQALLPHLRKGKGKKIVNITSFLGSIADNTGGMYSYRASKAALNMLASTMGLELGKEGFTVVALHPGWVRTDMGGAEAPLSPEESIEAMIGVIRGLKPTQNGHFLDLHGQEVRW